jgi:hypothetical protein
MIRLPSADYPDLSDQDLAGSAKRAPCESCIILGGFAIVINPNVAPLTIPIWLTKLRMVEGVKELCRELQIYSFLDKRVSEVRCPIIQARRGEEPDGWRFPTDPRFPG